MREQLRALVNEVADILDEVYDWDASDLRSQVIAALEDIQDSLEETIRKL